MWLQRALEAKTSITNVGLRFKNNEKDTLNVGARVLEWAKNPLHGLCCAGCQKCSKAY